MGGCGQAVGSWSMDACCSVPTNRCGPDYCADHASSSDWLFGLWPGPPQRFEPVGTKHCYQTANAKKWPQFGTGWDDLSIGDSGAPGGSYGYCKPAFYHGTNNEICGGTNNWGATDVEVWYPLWPAGGGNQGDRG